MFTRTTWTHYDQSHLLTGGGLTGVGVEIDRHLDGLRAEAEARRLADATADDRRVVAGPIRLAGVIPGRHARQPSRPAARAG